MTRVSMQQTPLQNEQLFVSFNHTPTFFDTTVSGYAHPLLCTNAEGWGPLSSLRYDFTPCFLDVWTLVVVAWGILAGPAAVWYLKTKPAQDVPKNWHFYAKLVVLSTVIVSTAVELGLQVQHLANNWAVDIRFYTIVGLLVSEILIWSIQYLEHFRSRNPNGVVLFYWVFFIVAYGVKLYSLVERKAYKTRLPYFVASTTTLGLAVSEFLLEYCIAKKQSAYDALGAQDECPIEYADIFSILTFGWLTPMMKYGYHSYLTADDLWNLRQRDTTKSTGDVLQAAWAKELDKKKPSLSLALARSFGGPYLRGAMIKTISDVLQFAQPQLLRLLIGFVHSYSDGSKPMPTIYGVVLALGMFLVSVVMMACQHQYFQRVFETGMRVKSSLISMIYGKSLKLSNEARSEESTGDIVNHMSVDVQRLADLAQWGLQIWSAPFQIVLCLVSLYQLVGAACFAGVTVMVIMIPVNGMISRYMKKLQRTQMKYKDSRTKLMTEILNNMKAIKLYAWGSAFLDKLSFVRNDQELNNLRKIGAAQSVATFTSSSTPFFVSCGTFALYTVIQDKPLTTEIVFPCLTLFNLLQFPLTVLPLLINAIVEASVAVGRLSNYFCADELQTDAVQLLKEPAAKLGDESIRVRDGVFTWDKNQEVNALENINFTARKGELTCLVGRVGSGKSSVLHSLLGDLWKHSGKVVVRGHIAYVAQSPWVMNASVKENIVFGHRWDPHFYSQTINACALVDDFRQLPDGDSTQVGERGISLSGGQKARLTLARAVYARADVYLLDDVLSAVDNHVGRHLIDNVLGPKGLLKTKARILATNSIPVLKEADYIYLIRDKTFLEKGTYQQLMAMRGEVSHLIKTASSDDDDASDGERSPSIEAIDSEGSTIAVNGGIQDSLDDDEAEEAKQQVATLPESIRPGYHTAARMQSYATLRKASDATLNGLTGRGEDEEQGLKTMKTKEASSQGKVKWSVYGAYAKESNYIAVGVYMFSLIASQVAQVWSSFWLKEWTDSSAKFSHKSQVVYFLGVYFSIGMAGAVLVVLQNMLLWIFCSIEASRKLHDRMAFAIFRSPMSFFETTPTGRILNRFSSDIYRIDEIVARTFNMLFTNTGRAAFTLGIIAVSTPAFMILVVPLGFVYIMYQKYYLRSSRELSRLDSVSRSPIFAHFQESLGGLSTIRAYRQEKRFILENEWRMDANLRAYFPSVSANRWLGVRLEFLGCIIIFSSAAFAIISVTTGGLLSAGMVGLAMSYALQITSSLNWIVRLSVEVETNIVSVERVLEYAGLEGEAPDVIFKKRPPMGWPANGQISIKNFSTRYREGLDLVLKDITLDIKPGEKIGVVGRTGAGKSSLTLALFRIIEPASGHISIDGVNTSTIGLMDLRRRLAIIPQDPALFQGTIRDNLDPRHVHDDTELWDVLAHARLKEHVASMPGQLEAAIHEGGSNLSQGQRQLVSLARALLTPSNILVLDEATAAVDIETDAMLQTTLRSSVFSSRTIITIAHRINTIMDSDRILVLQQGKVAEFDTPNELIKTRGLFYDLVREAGLLEHHADAAARKP